MGLNKIKDWFLGIIETYSSRLNSWAWDKRWGKRTHHDWIKGYNKWKNK